MADEPSWEDLFGQPAEPVRPATAPAGVPQYGVTQPTGATAAQPVAVASAPQPLSRRELRETQAPQDGNGRPPRKKRRRRLTWLWVLLTLIVLAGVGAGVVWSAFGPQIRHVLGWEAPIDYVGNGNGKAATVTIVQGQIGSDIAASLAKAHITKTSAAFYQLLIKQAAQPNFEPGTFKLQEHMSAKAALAGLLDTKNRIISNVVIQEGLTLKQILVKLSAGTGVPLADFQTAAKNYTALGVPRAAPSLEGFLFPATYQFDPGLPAKAILQRMVDRMDQSLKTHGVAKADELKVLTLASVIQKEGGSAKDFYKVSRVFKNRLAQGIHLQSDATVSYGAGSKTIATTAAQRADAGNKYNTYAHAGLPVGPISAPGDAAIDAAIHPASGSWLFFVLVNGYTGKTVFSDTLAEHNVAVLQWQAWLRAHPGYGS